MSNSSELYTEIINKLSELNNKLKDVEDKRVLMETAEFLTVLVNTEQFQRNILSALCLVYGEFTIGNKVIARFADDPLNFEFEYLKDGSGLKISSTHLNVAEAPEQHQ